MLVLTRKLKEQIQIGDNITLTILRVKGNTVRVGIEAPRDVRVVRSELPPHDGAPQSEAAIYGAAVVQRPSSDESAGDSPGDEAAEGQSRNRQPINRLHQIVSQVTGFAGQPMTV